MVLNHLSPSLITPEGVEPVTKYFNIVPPVKLTPKLGYELTICILVPPVIITVRSGDVLVIVTVPLLVDADIPVPLVTALTGKL